MQYMLLICGDESAAEHADEGCGGWSEEMAARGVIRGGGGLRPPNDTAAADAYREALGLAPTDAERRYLTRRLAEVTRTSAGLSVL